MKAISIVIISLLTGNVLFAQRARFVTSGSIEYEKTVNMYALARTTLSANAKSSFSDAISQAYDQYQKNHPQFATVKSTLIFNNNKTLFTPTTTGDEIIGFLGNNMVVKQFNTVYTDNSTSTRVVQKKILDNQFLVKDSLSKIKWRISGGTQDILGYTCREAHGLIQDSIYVVAFYTDKIWVNGGPESFSGLPGMILKLSLPHEHITWTATKVIEAMGQPAAPIVPPAKGKPVTNKELADILKKASQTYYMKIYML
jgi:GLPGLI family protein